MSTIWFFIQLIGDEDLRLAVRADRLGGLRILGTMLFLDVSMTLIVGGIYVRWFSDRWC